MCKVLFICLAFVLPFVSSSAIREDNTNVKEYFDHPKNLHHPGLSGRIIGGEEAIPHSYPFQVYYFIFSEDDLLFCSGTLVSNQWVLTSAHCLDGDVDDIMLVVGNHNLLNISSQAQVLFYSDYVIHEDWNDTTLQNDIGLVKLQQTLTFNEFIQPVTLAKGEDRYEGDEGTTIGWGQTEDEALSEVLFQVNSTILTNEECASSNSAYEQIIVNSHICLSGAGNVGICNGDSGGPLLVDGVQVGITSFVTTNCFLGMPSVFTRVTEYYDWIVEHAGLELEDPASE